MFNSRAQETDSRLTLNQDEEPQLVRKLRKVLALISSVLLALIMLSMLVNVVVAVCPMPVPVAFGFSTIGVVVVLVVERRFKKREIVLGRLMQAGFFNLTNGDVQQWLDNHPKLAKEAFDLEAGKK